MEKELIDEKIVSNKYTHTKKHVVEYYLYRDEGHDCTYIPNDPAKEFKASKRSPICFSALTRELNQEKRDGKRYNRICYKVTDDLENPVTLTMKEKVSWIKIAKEHKLLPPHIKPYTAKNGKMVLDLEKCVPAQAYGYLATLRFIREDPGFVRAMVYLVTKRNVNFYTAYVLCHRICLTQAGHAVISVHRPYMSNEKLKDVDLPIHQMAGLYRFFKDPATYDKRNMYWNEDGYGGYYNCNSIIGNISKIKYSCRTKDLFNPDLMKVVESASDDIAEKHLRKIKKNLTKIEGMRYY